MLKFLALFCFIAAAQAAVVPKYYGEVVFMGDSITDWWRNDGKSVWDQNYEPLGAVNVGVAGDVTQQTIDRILGGNIANFNARVVVLMIGTNDLSRNFPEIDIYIRIGQILELIKQRLPNSKVILLGIFPRGGAEIHQRIRTTNGLIQLYDNGNTVRYLDMQDVFSTGLGQVRQELYWGDQLHLSTQGYQVWADTMRNLFNQVYYG